MAKFSIEYKRTVRLAPYETLTIGMRVDFDTALINEMEAFGQVRNRVDFWIDEERERLAPGE